MNEIAVWAVFCLAAFVVVVVVAGKRGKGLQSFFLGLGCAVLAFFIVAVTGNDWVMLLWGIILCPAFLVIGALIGLRAGKGALRRAGPVPSFLKSGNIFFFAKEVEASFLPSVEADSPVAETLPWEALLTMGFIPWKWHGRSAAGPELYAAKNEALASLGGFASAICGEASECLNDSGLTYMGMPVWQAAGKSGRHELTAYAVRSPEGIVWIVALKLQSEEATGESEPPPLLQIASGNILFFSGNPQAAFDTADNSGPGTHVEVPVETCLESGLIPWLWPRDAIDAERFSSLKRSASSQMEDVYVNACDRAAACLRREALEYMGMPVFAGEAREGETRARAFAVRSSDEYVWIAALQRIG